MKLVFTFFMFLGFLFISSNANSQVVNRQIGIKQLDSLITSNLDADEIAELGKSSANNVKTRGSNPCEPDYYNVVALFKNLKSNYISCCNGSTNYRAVGQILASIYSLINNSDCKWGASQWLAFGYYLNDYSNFVKRMDNCCK
jgi:hypothetical protein